MKSHGGKSSWCTELANLLSLLPGSLMTGDCPAVRSHTGDISATKSIGSAWRSDPQWSASVVIVQERSLVLWTVYLLTGKPFHSSHNYFICLFENSLGEVGRFWALDKGLMKRLSYWQLCLCGNCRVSCPFILHWEGSNPTPVAPRYLEIEKRQQAI